MKSSSSAFRIFLISLVLFVVSGTGYSQSLHDRIDQLLAETYVGPPIPLADDATYVRRVYLDLTGRVATAEQVKHFMANPSPTKRAELIDTLLASPEFPRHMAVTFDVMIMERRAEKHIKTPAWREFLHTAFKENRPLNKLAGQILAADGVDPARRAAARFYLDREGEPNLLTRDTGRIFFGVDLQCAQCHDHPLIDSYYQRDYYGLFSFFNRSFVFTDKTKKQSFYAEKSEVLTSFKSVFSEEEGTTGPFIPGGVELVEPLLKTTEAYKVEPTANVMPVPKHSRRMQMAEAVSSGQSAAFNRNMANRLWAHMFGQGLVSPVDLHHDDNLPFHAPLLDLLATELADELKFETRAFLRELALTNAYQRTFEPVDWDPPLDELQARLVQLETQKTVHEAEWEKLKVELTAQRLAAYKVQEEFTAAKKAALESIAKHGTVATAAAKANGEKAKVESSVNKSRSITTQLSATLKSTQAAKEFLDDSELAAILPVLEKRIAALGAAVEKQLPDLQKKTKAATAAQTAADSASQEVDKRRVVHDQVSPRQLAAQTKLAPFLETHRLLTQRQDLIARQIEQTQRAILLQTAKADIAAKETTIPTLEAELKSNDATLATAATVVAKLDPQVSQMEKIHAASAAKANVAATALDKQQAAMKLLAEAQKQWLESAARLGSNQTEVDATAITMHYAKVIRRLAADVEQLADAAAAAKATAAEHENGLKNLQQQMAPASENMAALESKRNALTNQLQTISDELQTLRSAQAERRQKSIDCWSRQAALAALEPLSPEEVAWSVLVATGVAETYRTSVTGELKKAATEAAKKAGQKAPADDWQPDPFELEAAIDGKLAGSVKSFVSLFGAAAGQPQNEFFATVDQALFVANGGTINGWLNPSGNNLTGRLDKLIEQPEAYAAELYLSVLNRYPTQLEKQSINEYLVTAKADDRVNNISRELAWALLASAEFRFNH